MSLDFRCGSKAEVQRGPRNVRCWGQSGHRFRATEGPLLAISRLTPLFNNNRNPAHCDAGGGSRPQHDNGTYEFQFLDRDMLADRVQCRARTPATLRPHWSGPPENDLQAPFTAVIGTRCLASLFITMCQYLVAYVGRDKSPRVRPFSTIFPLIYDFNAINHYHSATAILAA